MPSSVCSLQESPEDGTLILRLQWKGSLALVLTVWINKEKWSLLPTHNALYPPLVLIKAMAGLLCTLFLMAFARRADIHHITYFPRYTATAVLIIKAVTWTLPGVGRIDGLRGSFEKAGKEDSPCPVGA